MKTLTLILSLLVSIESYSSDCQWVDFSLDSNEDYSAFPLASENNKLIVKYYDRRKKEEVKEIFDFNKGFRYSNSLLKGTNIEVIVTAKLRNSPSEEGRIYLTTSNESDGISISSAELVNGRALNTSYRDINGSREIYAANSISYMTTVQVTYVEDNSSCMTLNGTWPSFTPY